MQGLRILQVLKGERKLSEELRKQNASATDWMEFYENLFEEKSPVKGNPLPIEDDTEELSKKDNN